MTDEPEEREDEDTEDEQPEEPVAPHTSAAPPTEAIIIKSSD
ncbi:hypothetical protein [Gryllotalpicola protaetiae]|nr:hypothetical protein [Gryllotalpicola protaetiae]